MPHASFQCPSGASGDMLLGALLDAGASLEAVRAAVALVAPERVVIETEPVRRAGLAALRAHVRVGDSHHRRGWSQIRDLIIEADEALPEGVRHRALDTFRLLAQAEAVVHGIDVDEVHFHEVGALDAIADIVGVAAALEDLGVTEVHADVVAVGSGTTHAGHGLLPVPVPAVVELFRGTGATVVPGEVSRELCTPTGAALLVSQVGAWGPPPSARVVAAGAGAGRADHPHCPNVLRVVILDPSPVLGRGGAEPVQSVQSVVSANVDDLDPRVWPYVVQQLLEVGADDAWLTPILMKKGRPAHQVSALCSPRVAHLVSECLFRETSTIGVRTVAVDKVALPRTERTVLVEGHPVRVKQAWLAGGVVNEQAEHDDLVAVARATGKSLRTVLDAARGR